MADQQLLDVHCNLIEILYKINEILHTIIILYMNIYFFGLILLAFVKSVFADCNEAT
jgi:hypothetical protein